MRRARLEEGVGTVIITLGAAGVPVVTAVGAEHVAGFTVDAVDITGAGTRQGIAAAAPRRSEVEAFLLRVV